MMERGEYNHVDLMVGLNKVNIVKQKFYILILYLLDFKILYFDLFMISIIYSVNTNLMDTK